MTQEALPHGSRTAAWLARLSIALVVATAAVVAVAADLRSLGMLAVGLAAAVVSLTAAFWFLSRHGVLRWLSLALFVAAPVAVIVVYALHSLLWVALVAAGWLLAGIDGETVSLPVPVRCAVRPGALRVWVPRDRPGVPPELDWARLRQLAGRSNGARPAVAPEAASAPPEMLKQDSA